MAGIKKELSLLPLYFDEFVANKIEPRAKGEADARANTGNERETTTESTGGVDGRATRDGETIDTNQQQPKLPDNECGDQENGGLTGWNTGNVYTEDGVSEVNSGMDGQQAPGSDEGNVRRNTENYLV